MNNFKNQATWEFFKKIFDNYTDEDWEVLNKVEKLIYFGRPIECCLRESPYVSIEGIQEQLDNIECPTALIYYAFVQDGKARIDQRAVEIELNERR